MLVEREIRDESLQARVFILELPGLPLRIGQAEGGFYEIFPPSCQVNGKWLAVPHSIVGNAVAYRKSWLKEAGASEFPKTWEEARKLFPALKNHGPVAQPDHREAITPGTHTSL